MTEYRRQFKFDKETEKTIRYKEVSNEEPEICGFLYLKKFAAGKSKEVEVTVRTKS